MHSNEVQNKNALIVFAKFPVLGSVKTRLAETTDDKFAFNIYHLLARNSFGLVAELSDHFDVYLYYSNQSDEKKVKEWVGNDFRYKPQKGSDLGEKMRKAFAEVFKLGYEKCAIIGTDVPDHSSGNLLSAFQHLNNSDLVIGPSDDGGYYLLGMKKHLPFLFENIEWSSDKVLNKTIKILKLSGMDFTMLPVLSDIDTEEDLLKWLNVSNNIELKTQVKKLIQKRQP